MPDAVTVRPTTAEDRADALRVVREAFSGGVAGGQEEVEIVETVWASGPAAVACDLVAVSGGEIVGHVLASLGRVGDTALPGIAPLAVRPDRQGRGIGTALMGDLLRRLRRRSYPLVVVLGDPAYYGRFGFQTSAAPGIHYVPVGAADPHFQVLRLDDDQEPRCGPYAYSWELPGG